MSATKIDKPTRVLLEREETSYPTNSKGCVICPSSTPQGPNCKEGEEQLLRSQTCDQCQEYYCAPKSDDGSSSTPIGPIVGGVVGGVAAVIIAGLLYYFLVWRKKHPSLDDDEDIVMSDLENYGDDKYSMSNDLNPDTSRQSGMMEGDRTIIGGSTPNMTKQRGSGTFERPPTRRTNSNPNRRLSSYESFTKPQARYKSQNNSRTNRRKMNQARARAKAQYANNQNQQQGGPYLDPNSGNRNSVATSISTTNASNILPIAYIPGVTVRPTKNNTKSIYSYETDSIFSDMNTIENASIVGDIMRANNYHGAPMNPHQEQSIPELNEEDHHQDKDATMTAIRAQPKLVNVDRIEEEEEADDDDDDDDDQYEDVIGGLSDAESNTYLVKRDNSGDSGKAGSINTSTHHVNDSTLTSDVIREDDDHSSNNDNNNDNNHNSNDNDYDYDSDSDVDSDIGEIQRATSVKRMEHAPKQVNSEIILDIQGPTPQSQAPDSGSFVLDVEIDDKPRPESNTSGETSPFEDPH